MRLSVPQSGDHYPSTESGAGGIVRSTQDAPGESSADGGGSSSHRLFLRFVRLFPLDDVVQKHFVTRKAHGVRESSEAFNEQRRGHNRVFTDQHVEIGVVR